MNGVGVIGLPAWVMAVVSAWGVSYEVGSAATLGYLVQWALKAPKGVADWIAPAVVLVGGSALYTFVLGNQPAWPLEREWVSGLMLWLCAALGVASASGRTGGAPKTNSA